MTTQENTHGGARAGAGRKQSPPVRPDAVPWFALPNAEFLEAFMSNFESNDFVETEHDKRT